jgi:outer membrane receptor protein involved in Fe transport
VERVTAVAGSRGAGRIWWDEANTLYQPYYSLLDASLSLRHGRFTVSLWGKNLLDESYGTFWFRSVSRSFISMGRPIRVGLKLTINT